MYDAVNHGWLEPRRLRRLPASTPLPHAADGRIVLAVDESNWLRPEVPTSSDLLFWHVYERGSSADQFISAGLLLRRSPGDGTHLVDPCAGRGPARAG